MRLVAVPLAVLVVAVLVIRQRDLPASGTLLLMRDEGGCLVGYGRGVQLEWSESGATIAPVAERMHWDDGHGTGPSITHEPGDRRPFPVERARRLAATFASAMTEDQPQLNLFRGRTMSIQLGAENAHLDCRDDYGTALADHLGTSADTWQHLRLLAYRAHLWRPPCEQVDPLLTALLDETQG